MVKGISRQVIVVHSPEPKLFEQAIFILKDGAVGQGVTDELLMKEARQAIRDSNQRKTKQIRGPVWAALGAVITGGVWLLTVLLG